METKTRVLVALVVVPLASFGVVVWVVAWVWGWWRQWRQRGRSERHEELLANSV